MSNKVLHSRIINIHDIESNWNKCISFIPKSGEIVVYDIDDDHTYPRFKLGDGVTSVVNLPFSTDLAIEAFFGEHDGVIHLNGGNIKEYE